MTPLERETIVRMSDGDDDVLIWTAQRTVITALRKKPDQFTELVSGFFGKAEWAEFKIAAADFRLANAARRRVSANAGTFVSQTRRSAAEMEQE